ncbi:MAG: type II secretion system GspH family protein [Gammaproteobacteria bacterium]|nr:type II secretion system GspH family protein [Gammaproteobacteria bacterium]
MNSKGFTLVEVAIVMLIIAFLIGAAIMPLRAQRESNNIKKAKADLQAIEEALYGFAITNGGLPCPSFPGLGGQQDVLDANNNCTTGFHGFVPSVDLGLRGEVNCDGLLVDPWGQPYRYSVTNSDAGNFLGADFVATNNQIQQEAAQPGNNLSSLGPNLQICNNRLLPCNAGSAAADFYTNTAVATIFSLGRNWANAPSALESENAGEGANIPRSAGCAGPAYRIANDEFFYYMLPLETAPVFDDIVTWISPNTLYSRMLQAGRLP